MVYEVPHVLECNSRIQVQKLSIEDRQSRGKVFSAILLQADLSNDQTLLDYVDYYIFDIDFEYLSFEALKVLVAHEYLDEEIV